MSHPPFVRWPPIRRHGRDPRRRSLSIVPAPAESAMAFDGGPFTSASLPPCGPTLHPPPHGLRWPHGKRSTLLPTCSASLTTPSIATRTAPSSVSLPNTALDRQAPRTSIRGLATFGCSPLCLELDRKHLLGYGKLNSHAVCSSSSPLCWSRCNSASGVSRVGLFPADALDLAPAGRLAFGANVAVQGAPRQQSHRR